MNNRSVIPLITILLLIILTFSFSYGHEVPFTQEDRDRLIRLEAKVEEGQEALNQRIENVEKNVNQRIDDLRTEMRDLRTFMLLGFGILFGAMGAA